MGEVVGLVGGIGDLVVDFTATLGDGDLLLPYCGTARADWMLKRETSKALTKKIIENFILK